MPAAIEAVACVLVVAMLVYAQHVKDSRYLAQIERLCQRIQAPDLAVAQAYDQSWPEPDPDEEVDEDPNFINIP